METEDDDPLLTRKDEDSAAQPQYRNVGLFSLLVISFFWASGGIYGNETLLQCAPPATVFLGLFLTPIVYSIPVALMTAELATAMPRDGGLVAWVTEACGTTIGGHNTYWQWISYIFDASVYPVLAGQYVAAEWDMEATFGSEKTGVSIVALMIVIFVTTLKLLGTQVLVRFSTVLLVLSISPSLIYMIWGLAYLEPKTWVVTESPELETDYSMLVSWLLWLYSGFFSLGSLAGEVDRPTYTFPRVIMILVPCVILFNVTPLAISISLDDDWNNYEAGHFTTLASQIAGEWLGYGFIMASNVCLIGLYNAQTMTCERSTSFFIESIFTDKLAVLRRSSHRFVRYLFHKGETGVAPLFILFNASIALVLIWFPYEFLVEFNMLQMSFVCVLFIYSYLYIRIKMPGMTRPFRVPGPLPFVFFISILPLACTVTNIYFALADNDELEVEGSLVADPYFKIFAFEAFVGAGFLANFLYNYRKPIQRRYNKLLGRDTPEDEGLMSENSSGPSSPQPEVASVYFKLQSREQTSRPRGSAGSEYESNV
eukprot:m.43866 g.43866  ORF g.43866 m.43866 type:complete len:541 (+) comp10840_c0_seq2:235-1857(+)